MGEVAARYSEPYNPTGGLAAEGVLNQLGRPDIEALEVLVREAVQNCWDAKRPDVGKIQVEIGRRILDDQRLAAVRQEFLVDPPPGLPLAEQLTPGMEILYFADFGTDGLGGPTRADRPGMKRDFVDFVRNIGQPPDKDLGGGSFGYGKAAFYIASRARTIIVDTLCINGDGQLERRLLACALGENFDEDGRPYTGRHWWGVIEDDVPEPLTGNRANEVAELLGLPDRSDISELGTTVVVVAPGVAPESDDEKDRTLEFIADAVIWNFWPRIISTSGGVARTMEFRLLENGRPVRLPDPRTHPRLRGFVEAMDRLREDPDGDDELVLDRQIECRRPMRSLGRIVIQKGPVAPLLPVKRAVPQGARITADSVHHVALMRNAELVVKYLPGPSPIVGRLGYSGVFRCSVDVDEAFRRAEPPTHDDWIYRSVSREDHQRTFVKVALERIASLCREAAGYNGAGGTVVDGDAVPLGEFADSLALLLPGAEGPGARRPAASTAKHVRKRRNAPGRAGVSKASDGVWVSEGVGGAPQGGSSEGASAGSTRDADAPPPVRRRYPELRSVGEPSLAIANDGTAVVRYAFELRTYGQRVALDARVEVMTNDGSQVEADAPLGYSPPVVRSWSGPGPREHHEGRPVVGPDDVDGRWYVEIPLRDEAMMRVDISAVVA
ncbi:hypothetical protein [Kribbella sp. VKM Ac-2568]|uniref:hypothetical protein n=1 Tax=Kribbella sp. VKM Ac-2568 TaxID=2512219 RepID=UPI00104DA446|nr:hypothetical protein [Kribbella sp. VKM Ac-2568]TCM39647.1 hypothetical protein EV648_114169 [Kribbella sp. VKM Ac-2568]